MKINTDEEDVSAAEAMADCLQEAEGLAQVVHDYLLKHQPSPMSVVFSGLVVDNMMKQQVPHWEQCKLAGIKSYRLLEGEGIIGDVPRLKDDRG